MRARWSEFRAALVVLCVFIAMGIVAVPGCDPLCQAVRCPPTQR